MLTNGSIPSLKNPFSINLDAYKTAKNSVGWRKHPQDIVLARGKDSYDLLQRMTTNNVLGLQGSDTGGVGVQNILLTDKARIIDVFTVLPRQNDLLMMYSGGMGQKAIEWLDKYTFVDDIVTENITSNYASFLVFGVRALQLLEEISGLHLGEVRTSSWLEASIYGIPGCIVVKQAPLCEFCYTVLVPSDLASGFEDFIRSLEGIAEIDDATFETLRIEAAWGKLGAEWTDLYNPLEAGLVGLVDFKKGCYIGQEVIARLDTYNKVKVRLMGFTANEPIAPNAHFYDESDGKRTDIGVVSSKTYSPELQQYIALGYIRSQFANPGAEALACSTDAEGVETRQVLTMTKLPFVM
ncbi:MAG: hypothetical protein MUF71_08205 [Candidatus Kapabacteria bacterium]|jgi:folate-binding protein YgfZ|nr:hypothetical protein [Candidatus Kapabacteria bacterium]